MTIHFFTIGDRKTASSRQRAFLVADELNKRNIKVVIHEPPVGLISEVSWIKKINLIWRLIKAFCNIKKEDIIFLQRTINKYFFPLIVFHKLIFRRKIIFDIDDTVYLYSYSSLLRVKILMILSNVVITGSHSLLDFSKKYNKNVYIIPTSILFNIYNKYKISKRDNNEIFTTGWIGNAIVHYENLKILKPVFEKLISNSINFKFVLIGSLNSEKVYSLFNNIKNLNVEFIDSLDWANSDEMPKAIQKFDVGLMPLVDTEWNRGKCAFKAIEYMACGVPTIASPVGENKYLIKDGVNGFLVSNTNDWADKLQSLINDCELGKKTGTEGRRTIEKEYCYEVNIIKLISVFKKL